MKITRRELIQRAAITVTAAAVPVAATPTPAAIRKWKPRCDATPRRSNDCRLQVYSEGQCVAEFPLPCPLPVENDGRASVVWHPLRDVRVDGDVKVDGVVIRTWGERILLDEQITPFWVGGIYSVKFKFPYAVLAGYGR